MDLGVVTEVVGLSAGDGKAVAEREIGGGAREVVQLQLPCVIGAAFCGHENRQGHRGGEHRQGRADIRQIRLGHYRRFV
jgi:electron transfer flavoprotein alpha/beta subunit